MTAPFLSDNALAELRMNPEWVRRGSACPTCLGTGTYCDEHGEHECPDDGWGMHEQHRLYRLYCTAHIPYEFMVLPWEQFPHADTKEKIDLWVASFERIRFTGRGMDLYGGHGLGKSWAAAHCLMEIVKQGYSGLWVDFRLIPSVIDMAKPEQRWWLEKMQDAEVLVVDEVKPATSTAQKNFYRDKLEHVLRQRAHSNFPTILTGNMSQAEYRKAYPRIAEQLSGKQWEFELQGESYRPQADEDSMILAANRWVRPLV